MNVAIVGDAMLDVDVSCGGFVGVCCENHNAKQYKGQKLGVFAGGAGSVATIISGQRASVSLYCDGPGTGDKAFIGNLFKQAVRANRVIYSGQGSLPLKMRGFDQYNQVVARIDAEAKTERKSGFPALLNLLDDVAKYDVVVVSDYAKGTINEYTEQVIVDILRSAKCSVVDSKRSDFSLWKHATAIVPNHQEAMSIYGSGCPAEIQQMVGCKAVYITRGKAPVLLAFDDYECEITVDENVASPMVVGAGDAFTAGVALALGSGKDFVDAGQAGVKLAQAYVGRGRKSNLR